MSRPVVIIPCDTKVIEGMTFDAVGRKYSAAVAEVAECQPLLAPLGPSMLDMGALLDIADGILLSGAVSNVHPSLYGLDEPPLNENALDPERDSLTLPLIREALNRKVPLFAICRGFQELNVALGGTLDQAVHTVGGRNDHREPSNVPVPLDGEDVTVFAYAGAVQVGSPQQRTADAQGRVSVDYGAAAGTITRVDVVDQHGNIGSATL